MVQHNDPVYSRQVNPDTGLRPVVFVVDDEPMLLRALARLLKELPIDVEVFDRPAEVLARCAQLEPRLVITDLRMPEMTGLQLAAAIHLNYPNVKIILHTGTPHEASTEFALLIKPASKEEVQASVRAALAG